MSSKRTGQVSEDLVKLQGNSWLLLNEFPTKSRENFSWRRWLLDVHEVQAFLCRKTAIRRILAVDRKEKMGNMILLGNVKNLLAVTNDKRYNKLMVQGSSKVIKLYPPYNLSNLELRSLTIVSLMPKIFLTYLLFVVDNLKTIKSS